MEAIFENTDMIKLGQVIRDVRERSGMTTKQMADAAGSLTRPTLTRIELGQAQSASFDTLFRLLMVIGELPIIRDGDFDLRPYGKEIQGLIRFFIRDAKGDLKLTYNQAVSKQIAENCVNWSKDEMDSLLFQVQCRNGINYVQSKVESVRQTLADKDMNVRAIDNEGLFCHIKDKTDFIYRFQSFLSNFKQDGKYDEIYDLTGELLDKTLDYIKLKIMELEREGSGHNG